jgi:hypothetical protein
MQIRLKHSATSMLLSSLSQSYSNPGSSGQQMVVGSAHKNTETVWLVKGNHNAGDSYPAGEAVKHGDFIRLEHISTRKNLHSHGDRLSPLTRQQEVTAYGFSGIGDENDDWMLDLENPGDWHIGSPIRLIHKSTVKALHSHAGYTHPIFTAGGQEVTALPKGDLNDLWVCDPDDQLPAANRFTLPKLPDINLVSLLGIAGSIASITGWTLLTLKGILANHIFADSLAFVFSSAITLGFLMIITSFLLSYYHRLTFNPKTGLWRTGFWMVSGAIYILIFLATWRVIALLALHWFSPFLQWIFGN